MTAKTSILFVQALPAAIALGVSLLAAACQAGLMPRFIEAAGVRHSTPHPRHRVVAICLPAFSPQTVHRDT